jgi:membrane-bound lytic murein transglycosylase D
MKMVMTLALFLSHTILVAAPANPKVPTEMRFGDLRLKFTEAARRDIQKDVDALRAYPKYFQVKVDRMNLYFPIVERIFKEEKVPDEFKFLAIQESALISDAVSSANAVGFWQFKEPAGKEVGLRIDRNVDERLNIVASSRGAAKYLKRMNFYFKNWVYACLAYNRGPGGAKKYVDQKKFGVKKMTIDKNTFWYVKKFFAH